MSQVISGNVKGLSPSELRKLERLAERRLPLDEVISVEFARELFHVASELRRRLGVLVTREGRIEALAVGTRDILYLPPLGRARAGEGRLRRLRLLFSDLSESGNEPKIPHDIFTDLEKLRLDLVAGVKPSKAGIGMAFAHLKPGAEGSSVEQEMVPDIGRLDWPLNERLEAIESEFSRYSSRTRRQGKPTAMLVGVYDSRRKDVNDSVAELRELARTADVTVVGELIQRRTPDPKTLLGKGKLEEVMLACLRRDADIVIFDTELRPSQWRAVTNATELKVLDRSMLILDIFAQRAQSAEGRLQVELAQLKYNLPRLVEFDSGLSRLSGGIGGRGPGETKLEIGRRRARERIAELERRIEQLGGQRRLRGATRRESAVPLVAIVGYTNVGKSSLFNRLTKAKVLAEDKLFATLDPTHRRFRIADEVGSLELVLSDTVGFIRDLPAELRNAFRATLEQLYDAALLLHVLDGSDPRVEERYEQVRAIVDEMKIEAVPELVVVNKADRATPEVVASLVERFQGVSCSAVTGAGIGDVVSAIGAALRRGAARPRHSTSETGSPESLRHGE